MRHVFCLLSVLAASQCLAVLSFAGQPDDAFRWTGGYDFARHFLKPAAPAPSGDQAGSIRPVLHATTVAPRPVHFAEPGASCASPCSPKTCCPKSCCPSACCSTSCCRSCCQKSCCCGTCGQKKCQASKLSCADTEIGPVEVPRTGEDESAVPPPPPPIPGAWRVPSWMVSQPRAEVR